MYAGVEGRPGLSVTPMYAGVKGSAYVFGRQRNYLDFEPRQPRHGKIRLACSCCDRDDVKKSDFFHW